MSRLRIAKPTITKPAVPLRTIALGVSFIAVTLLSGATGAWLQSRHQQNLITTGQGSQKKIITQESQLISSVAKKVGPSVVSVNVSITSQSQVPDLFGFSQGSTQAQGAGTGIIISKDIVMTNRHVVPSGTTRVSITLSDGTELRNVSVIGRTSDNDSLDIAFLKINDLKGRTLTPAALGDSGTVEVGDNVVAIGNALGQFQNTVTSGIISGYGRSVQAGDNSGQSQAPDNLDDLFQTDAAINEGNSGGPLVNLSGQVIGINTAVAGNAQNIGFAIPISDVRGLIDQVLKSGKFSRPYLGVRYVPITADVATAYELPVQQGAYILPATDPSTPSILPGSPAEKAQLKESDIIQAVDGKKIDQNHSLTSMLSKHTPGDRVTLKILRDKKTLNVSVTIGELPTGEQ